MSWKMTVGMQSASQSASPPARQPASQPTARCVTGLASGGAGLPGPLRVHGALRLSPWLNFGARRVVLVGTRGAQETGEQFAASTTLDAASRSTRMRGIECTSLQRGKAGEWVGGARSEGATGRARKRERERERHGLASKSGSGRAGTWASRRACDRTCMGTKRVHRMCQLGGCA